MAKEIDITDENMRQLKRLAGEEGMTCEELLEKAIRKYKNINKLNEEYEPEEVDNEK